MHVLVVDDDPDIANIVKKVVDGEGHKVTAVNSGSEALSASLSNEFDLLICDMMLPDLSGTEIVRALKAQSPQLPVILLSALNPDDYKAEIEDIGASCFLQKPLRFDDMRRELRMVAEARAQMSIVLVDADPIHRVRITKTLEPMGCTVHPYGELPAAREAIEGGIDASLLILGANFESSLETLKWAHGRGLSTFIFAEPENASREEEFMRNGASLFMTKPIDVDALMTQARFLAHF